MSEKTWTLNGAKFRIREWIDLSTNATWYGIQCKPRGESRYMHATQGRDALIFPTRDRALAKVRELTA